MCGAELKALPEGVQRVAAVLQQSGHPHMPIMLDDAARTAQQAADALGVRLGQIAKSIIFRRKSDDAAVLVVTSGDRRVDERKVEALVCADGKRVGRADAEFVKSKTGFSIGGVSPVGHITQAVVLVDLSLMRFDEVWAAAGHPHAVFKLMPQELELLTGAPVVDVAVDLDEEKMALEQAIDLVTERGRTVEAAGDVVPSPCISVCRINAESGMCEGCFRTLGEISAWARSGPDMQRELWRTIGQRMAAVRT
jgi:prolyl-tRNA editing enzyme YbaK/EbsC (Cys-tRNA(Pro) deacylase)/predicted Fe-S protein YdhL (DUF1289 family)